MLTEVPRELSLCGGGGLGYDVPVALLDDASGGGVLVMPPSGAYEMDALSMGLVVEAVLGLRSAFSLGEYELRLGCVAVEDVSFVGVAEVVFVDDECSF